jgi:hypothetical protein
MATKKTAKTLKDKSSDLKKTYERVCRRGKRQQTKTRGFRVPFYIIKQCFFAMCIVSLIIWMYLHLFI